MDNAQQDTDMFNAAKMVTDSVFGKAGNGYEFGVNPAKATKFHMKETSSQKTDLGPDTTIDLQTTPTGKAFVGVVVYGINPISHISDEITTSEHWCKIDPMTIGMGYSST